MKICRDDITCKSEKSAGLFATTVLFPVGQWIIAGGAVLVALGLTINAKIATKHANEGLSNLRTKQIE